MSLVNRLINIFVDGEYYIGCRKLGGKTLLDCGNVLKFKLLKPNWKYWYADPILWEHEGQAYIFMEVYDRIKQKGFIGVSKILDDGTPTSPKKIIEESFHMSFPHIFKYGENVYMMPETIAGGNLRIYKMGNNICDWSLFAIIPEIVNCVDSITSVFGDKIYILTGQQDTKNKVRTCQRLYVIDDWSNMMVREIKLEKGQTIYSYESRNAGPIVSRKGIQYRISQVSTDDVYGKSMKVHKIERIDETGFEEKYVKDITIDNIDIEIENSFLRCVGMHTYGKMAGYEVIDIYVAKASIFNAIRKIFMRGRG